MSTTQQPDQQTGGRRRAPDDRDSIDLGRGGRGWLVPLIVGLVLIAVVVGLFLKFGGGSDAKAVEGSHFSNNFQVAYQASSASEAAFLEYLDDEIAPDHASRTATSWTRPLPTATTSRTSTSTSTGSSRSPTPPA
jgi:D-methionine transport system substrate-binding protein